jgi:hypothetical protein
VGSIVLQADNGQNRILREFVMSVADTPRLPATFNRLAWSNLAAQSAEQIALAAAPIVAVLLLGVGEGQTGLLQTALTLPSSCSRFPQVSSPTASRGAG